MFSLIVYTHMVVCILLYCILASPFFLIAGIFCLLTGRPFSVAVLKFIRTFFKNSFAFGGINASLICKLNV